MTVTADTIRLVSQGEYIIGDGKTLTDSDFAVFLKWATDQFAIDNPGNATDSIADQAISLLVCHYIDRAQNDQHIRSENAGDGTTGFDETGSNWMKSYQAIVSSLIEKSEREQINLSVGKKPARSVTRKDATVSVQGMYSSNLSG